VPCASRAFFPTCVLPCTRSSHGRHSPRFAYLLALFTLARIACLLHICVKTSRSHYSINNNRNAHYIVTFKNPLDQTGIRTILLQAFPDRWRPVLRLFKRVTSRLFGYLILDVHPASDDRYRLWSHLTPREGKAQVHTLPVDVPAVRKSAATRTRT